MYFLILTPEKIGNWWELNPHCSGGRRCNHITRISPLAKYPKFSGVTAICRGSMTGKVLTRQLNGKTESGWDLNTRPLNTAKVTLHYALLCLHQVHQVSCRYCRASRHRYRNTSEKVLKYTFTKTGSWWKKLNTHCLCGRRYNHITHINPFAKYPTLVTSLLEVAAEWREKSWLDS